MPRLLDDSHSSRPEFADDAVVPAFLTDRLLCQGCHEFQAIGALIDMEMQALGLALAKVALDECDQRILG